MKNEIVLYTRKGCCLCEEMKEIVRSVTARRALDWREIDVDEDETLRERYGHEVPVLFVNGRKAFKYRVTAKELERHLSQRA
ncbi:MAG TPA: glutaredoxin family protein [candidate division Zixibacteria bacterium]|nr:glutaredoxin family protein [candidate division Zixibacteria bacterium]